MSEWVRVLYVELIVVVQITGDEFHWGRTGGTAKEREEMDPRRHQHTCRL